MLVQCSRETFSYPVHVFLSLFLGDRCSQEHRRSTQWYQSVVWEHNQCIWESANWRTLEMNSKENSRPTLKITAFLLIIYTVYSYCLEVTLLQVSFIKRRLILIILGTLTIHFISNTCTPTHSCSFHWSANHVLAMQCIRSCRNAALIVYMK